jgi:hypothetical protein
MIEKWQGNIRMSILVVPSNWRRREQTLTRECKLGTVLPNSGTTAKRFGEMIGPIGSKGLSHLEQIAFIASREEGPTTSRMGKIWHLIALFAVAGLNLIFKDQSIQQSVMYLVWLMNYHPVISLAQEISVMQWIHAQEISGIAVSDAWIHCGKRICSWSFVQGSDIQQWPELETYSSIGSWSIAG